MKIISQLTSFRKSLNKLLTYFLLTFDLYVSYFGFLPAFCCGVLCLFWQPAKQEQHGFYWGHNLLSFNIVCSCIDAYLGVSHGAVQQAPIVGSRILHYLEYNWRYLVTHREAWLLALPVYSCGYFMFKRIQTQVMPHPTPPSTSVNNSKPVNPNKQRAAPVVDHPSENNPQNELQQSVSSQSHGKNVFINDGMKKDKAPNPYAKILKPVNNTVYQSLKPGPTNKLFDQVPEVTREFNDTHKEMLRSIESLFQDFAIPAAISKCVVGYSVIIFAIEATKRIKLDILKKLEPDLTSALGAPAKITEHNAMSIPLCIEIPNKNKVILRTNQVLNKLSPLQKTLSPLSFTLGITLSEEVYRVQMDDLPHLLIAGTTGSGKSVCLHTIITGLLLTTPITSHNFIMIDPKVIELNFYSKLPNLLMPIIYDPQDANLALSWLIEEMESRYRLLSQFNVRNIKEYNKHHIQLHRPQPLKSIILVIDEFGDLVLDKNHNFSNLLIKLAQKSRAAGIHIILTTQRPSANVVTGLLKANIPSRIALQVSSKIESRIILDHNGAEALHGNGDLLFYRPGAPLIRIQSPYISPQEITKIAEFWS